MSAVPRLISGKTLLLSWLIIFTQSLCFSQFLPQEVKPGRFSDNDIKLNHIIHSLTASVVRINTKQGKQIDHIASGFVVDSKGLVVTCSHVVKDKEYLEVEFRSLDGNFKSYKASLIAVDDTFDIAILRVIKRDCIPVKFLSSSEIVMGVDLAMLGYPFNALSINKGVLSNISYLPPVWVKSKNWMKYLLIDMTANEGSSGSPIFLINTGEVVGVMQGNFNPFAEAADMITIGGKPAFQYYTGLSVATRSEDIKPIFKKVGISIDW